ncbi:hypothetical protein LCGC14_2047730 [marine sediment metagenome]|uniref:Uncharacterized protein n=1 Tax=marine sediment metagenome TaxID=412755 RepID=A0A0F9FCG6_9ZZZZ
MKKKKNAIRRAKIKNSKAVQPNNLIEVKNHTNLIFFADLYESPIIEDIERENKEIYQNII